MEDPRADDPALALQLAGQVALRLEPATLTTAKATAEETHASKHTRPGERLHDRALAILDLAERERDFRMALAAIREARDVMELLVKIAGPVPATVPTIIWDFDPATTWPDPEPPKYVADDAPEPFAICGSGRRSEPF